MFKPRNITSIFFTLLLFVLPASTTYEMHDFGFGSGGSSIGDSANYSITGISGEISDNSLSGSSYDLGPGLQFARQSNVPNAPTLTNPSNYYNKLLIVLDPSNNPSDTQYAIAISTDSFTTTQYLQENLTIGTVPFYQTYTLWGGASGSTIVGLSPNTTYQVKVKAIQTKYTESGYSVASTAATTTPSLSFDIDISSTDSETSPPYLLTFNNLSLSSVTTLPSKIWIDLQTNAEQGAFVYAKSGTTGLVSTQASHTISSISGDLSSSSEGYGIQSNTTSQNTGGPLIAINPYNASGDTVGQIDTTNRNIYSSSDQPISNGRASLLVKAKASLQTPAANDYTSTITLTASGSF